MRILLIEPDSATAQSIELTLKSEGFNVYTTDIGEEGVDLGKIYDYDLILLELTLPDLSGLDVLRALRVGKIQTPIMILTGCAEIDMKVKTFGAGADDYMTKPFHKDELVARIHAVIRRSKGHAQSVIKTGNLTVNLDDKTVMARSVRVHLTGKEYQMMELLSLRKGTTLTKEMFLNHLYGGMDEPELKIIDVFICKLRKKLGGANDGNHHIETVWGRGYVLRDPVEATAGLTSRPVAAVSAAIVEPALKKDKPAEALQEMPVTLTEALKTLILSILDRQNLTSFSDLVDGVDGRWSEASIRVGVSKLVRSGEVVNKNKGVCRAARYALVKKESLAA